ncbi:MAG: RNA-binding transcriptional accessory protein [Candidatus Hydrogenedentes bacterium]|nr:RNA-binding transcriptional accessory protein [Candidatus Hydrogenedentota bacterium]
MNATHITKISRELKISTGQVTAVATLFGEGATIPFVARYRKEATGSLDEVALTSIRDRLDQLGELDKRREAILKSLEERNLLSDELKAQVEGAETMTALEDVYLPYRPKRRTRATVAREKGLEPLALLLLAQDDKDPEAEARAFVDADKGVADTAEALQGARDIIAEMVSQDIQVRERMRTLYMDQGLCESKVVKDKEEEGAKYKDYFDWREPASKAPSHRLLAMFRGENEGFLSLNLAPEETAATTLLEDLYVKGSGAAADQVKIAIDDSYKRLLGPSMETELRAELKQRADAEAIRVFAENLRELLLSPPLGHKNVLALDPGFRTGCKLVCLDRQGKLIHDDVIYPHTGEHKAREAGEKVKALCKHFAIEAIAIGNGTASRETEAFVRALGLPTSIAIVMVNESGASIYSASEVAREEFPEKDLTVRGAVSIGRRLMDPLAELVKIDPKSIGVGQYQHDVDQGSLKRSLDDVVMSCVNGVGVNVNTASKQLLMYVSGLGPQLAGNIVAYRDENGPLPSRAALKKVPRLGPKAFEQAAGFLRIPDGKHPLDASAVHPESYGIVDAMAKDLGCSIPDLMRDEALRNKVQLSRYVTDKVGLETLRDIMAELAKPGRDPREQFEAFSFAEGVNEMSDLQPGMKLPGIVTNVTAFGAFVDIGVHQDGLVHISQLADRFIKEPGEVVKVHQKVMVTVVSVDAPRKRIALSMRANPEEQPARPAPSRPAPKQAPQQAPRKEPAPKKETLAGPDDFRKALADRFNQRN